MNYGWLITFSEDFSPLDSLTNALCVHTGVGGAWTFWVHSFLCAHLWMCPFIQAARWLITSASAPRLNHCCSHLEDSARIFIFSLDLHWNLLILLVCWRASVSLIHFECLSFPGLCVFCPTRVFSVILNCAVPICLMCIGLYCFCLFFYPIHIILLSSEWCRTSSVLNGFKRCFGSSWFKFWRE